MILDGELEVFSFDSDFCKEQKFDGELEVVCFDADFCDENKFEGEMNEVTNISTVPEYSGAYEVTPSEEGQVLMTSGFRMGDNVVIGAIPQNYGLLTWNGSTLRVS